MHGEQAHGVVLLGEGRGLGLAAGLARARGSLEQDLGVRLAIGHPQQLAHVGDALLAAREEHEHLFQRELTHGLAERAAGAEPRDGAAEAQHRVAHLGEVGAIPLVDEGATRSLAPLMDVELEAAVRARSARGACNPRRRPRGRAAP